MPNTNSTKTHQKKSHSATLWPKENSNKPLPPSRQFGPNPLLLKRDRLSTLRQYRSCSKAMKRRKGSNSTSSTARGARSGQHVPISRAFSLLHAAGRPRARRTQSSRSSSSCLSRMARNKYVLWSISCQSFTMAGTNRWAGWSLLAKCQKMLKFHDLSRASFRFGTKPSL